MRNSTEIPYRNRRANPAESDSLMAAAGGRCPASLMAMTACIICSSRLKGRQRMYCSRQCKNRSANSRLQSYRQQQHRGKQRKLRLIVTLGGSCIQCGYDKNTSALEFHHRVPADKSFQRKHLRIWSDCVICRNLRCSTACPLRIRGRDEKPITLLNFSMT